MLFLLFLQTSQAMLLLITQKEKKVLDTFKLNKIYIKIYPIVDLLI